MIIIRPEGIRTTKKEAHDHTDSKRVSHEEKNDKDDTENKETKKDNSSSSMKNRQ